MRNGLTQKQEIYTQNLFKGMYQRDAYIDAYHPAYALSTIDANASRLAKNEKVSARLKELRQKAEDATIADVKERKQVLTEIIRGRFSEFMTQLTPEKLKSAALQEIRITTIGKEKPIKTTTIKLNDPVKAIAELNKMEHIYEIIEPSEVNIYNQTLNVGVRIDAKNLSDAELLAIISRNGGKGNGSSGKGSQ